MEMLDFAVRNNALNDDIEVIRTGIIDVSMIDMLKEFPAEYGVQRLIDRGNVNRIKKSMQQTYIPSVIKVNQDWCILDGAHSKQSIKELALQGVQLVYVMYDTKGRDREVCVALNTTSKKWTTVDFMEIWISSGKEDYIWFKNIWYKYELNFQSTLLLTTGKARGGNNGEPCKTLREFKDGTMKLSQERRNIAIDVAEKLIDIRGLVPKEIASQRNFDQAVIRMAFNEKYDHNRMLNKLSYQRDRVYRCSSQNGYIEMLESIYNYKTNNKVHFTSK